MALAVIGDGDHLVAAALLLVTLGKLGEERARREFLPVVEVAEHVRRPADGERPVGAAGEELARVDDVDRAQGEALVDVGFLAERRGREHFHVVAAVRALLDLPRRPHRGRVVRLARFIDVRPFELRLRRALAATINAAAASIILRTLFILLSSALSFLRSLHHRLRYHGTNSSARIHAVPLAGFPGSGGEDQPEDLLPAS